ncbi:MAG: PrgI family protein [Candidatus Woykebacteria bacterium]
MQQHPVPQNITGFEFKLIGFLTIKQFAYLAVAGIFSFVFFISPIPVLVKIIVISPIALFGAALAFVPVNGLPFEKWLVVFISSIYSPSRRVWHKGLKEISFLAPSFSRYLKRPPGPAPKVLPDKSRLESFLTQMRGRGDKAAVDRIEEQRISQIDFSATVPHFSEIDNEGELEPTYSKGSAGNKLPDIYDYPEAQINPVSTSSEVQKDE